jgi:NAD(P)-dependent dehydrogenase (short-subunit alcohol dehydrogenase family)
MELRGARVLVAGGAHRVGREIALDLARAGSHVAISYFRSARPAEQTRADIEAHGVRSAVIQADAARPDQMHALVASAAEALGGLDVYVHAPSGGFVARPPQEVDEPLWDEAMESTAKGFMFAAQAAHRHMSDGGGVIVAVNDVAGLQPWPLFAAHCAAKAAQAQLVKCLAAAWGRDGVRVNAVAPGPVLMPDHLGPAAAEHAASETALGRLGAPGDVAHAIRFLLEADYVTGTNVIVDGGRLLAS